MGASRDQLNKLEGGLGVIPQLGTVAAHNGIATDMQGFSSVTFFASLGAAGVGILEIQESDDSGSGYTTVTDLDDLLTAASVALVQSDVVKMAYVGNKRYVRAVITLTTGGQISCPSIQGYASIEAV